MITTDELNHLKYPIGPFTVRENIDQSALEELISVIASAPAKYRDITEGLSKNDLKKTYREGSWNIQQLVNHVADMQMLHFFRMKKALTEADYKEITLVSMDGWAKTFDGIHSNVNDSLDMFESITRRFVLLMKSLDEKQLGITYYHPVRKIMLDQRNALGMNAWHVRHHLEHIKIALKN